MNPPHDQIFPNESSANRETRRSGDARVERSSPLPFNVESVPSNKSRTSPLDHKIPAAEPLPKKAPPQPGQTIEVGGQLYALRGRVAETEAYVRAGRITTTDCLMCTVNIHVIDDTLLVICPVCRCVGPSGNQGTGVGLGFTEDWRDWQRELKAMLHGTFR